MSFEEERYDHFENVVVYQVPFSAVILLLVCQAISSRSSVSWDARIHYTLMLSVYTMLVYRRPRVSY